MSLEDDFDDDVDYDEETGEVIVCPECGSDNLEVIGEDDDGNNLYECQECGEEFADGEEEEE